MATLVTRRDPETKQPTGFVVRWNYRPKTIDGKPYDSREFVASKELQALKFKAEIEKQRTKKRKTLGGPLISDLCDAYMQGQEYLALEQRTRDDIEACVRVHIKPGIGTMRHDEIASTDVKAFLRTLTITGYQHLSPPHKRTKKQSTRPAHLIAVPTANKVLRYLKALIRWCRVEDFTRTYAFDEVKGLKDKRPSDERRAQPRAYTDAEKQLLIAACKTLLERAVIETAWDSGLRRGELFALCWDAVDITNGEIRVKRALDGKGKFKEPKTHERRTVPLFDDGHATLTRWAEVVAEQRDITLKDLAKSPTLIFMAEDGKPLDASWESRHAGKRVRRRPAKRPGIRGAKEVWVQTDGIRLRSGIHLELGHCRDTFASEIIATPGIEGEQIRMAMGHEDVNTTLRYYAAWIATARSTLKASVRERRAKLRSITA